MQAHDLPSSAALQLEALTQRQLGRRIVVAIDDRIYTAPTVQARNIQAGIALTAGRRAPRSQTASADR